MPTPILALALLATALAAPRAAAETIVANGRPATLQVPSGYSPATPAPLLILLHGYGASGAGQEMYMALAPLADQHGFLYLTPDGTVDCLANRHWNATDACCDFCGAAVDDSGYVLALIQATGALYSVDPDRIYLLGHSNGGFLAYRAACDHADLIAAIVSLAGATYQNAELCAPSEPVHTLQIHGTADATIQYAGGFIPLSGGFYPGAVTTAQTWATYDGCSLTPDTSLPNLDLTSSVAGAESTRTRYAAGCAPGGSAELWTMVGGPHIPALTPQFREAVFDYLLQHPQPGPAPIPQLPLPAALLLALVLLSATLAARSP